AVGASRRDLRAVGDNAGDVVRSPHHRRRAGFAVLARRRAVLGRPGVFAASAVVMRVAVLQLRVDDSEPQAARVARVASLVRAQAGADLVVLPELWVPGAFGYHGYASSAAELPGPALSAIAAAAHEIDAHVVAGTFIEDAAGRWHNTAVLLSPEGEITHTYRKVHLFGFDTGEATMLAAGDDVSVGSIDGVRFGMTTCYDLRFPELYRIFVDEGAEL